MVERRGIVSFIFTLLLAVAFSQTSEKATASLLKSKFELGFTPRFGYFHFNDFARTGKENTYRWTWSPRIQLAYEAYENSYIILFYDWNARRSNNSFYFGENYNGHKIGIQYSYKFVSNYIEAYLFQRKGVNRFLKVYPEVMIATGLSNLSSTLLDEDITTSNSLFFFYEFSVGLNMVLNNTINLQLVQGITLNPNERHSPYQGDLFLIKIIYKI